MSREFDLIVFGATGLTGGLIANYLAGIPEKVTVLLVGRNEAKLKPLAEKHKFDYSIVDLNDAESVKKTVLRASTAISTVGPYYTFGEPILAACAKNGTHYIDLSGESIFNIKMAKRYQEDAKNSGAVIVNSGGFDSVPSCLLTRLALQHANERFGPIDKVVEISTYVEAKAAISPGTFDSLMCSGENRLKAGIVRPRQTQHKVYKYVTYKDEHFYGGHFMLTDPNSQAVFRSMNIEKQRGTKLNYDPQTVKYNELMRAPTRFKAIFAGLFMGSVFFLFQRSSLFRYIFRNYISKSIPGINEKSFDGGYFKVDTIATTEAGRQVRAKMTGDLDPGYPGTAIFISELAIHLAKDKDSFPPDTAKGGFFTPSTIGVDAYCKRLLKDSGYTITVDH